MNTVGGLWSGNQCFLSCSVFFVVGRPGPTGVCLKISIGPVFSASILSMVNPMSWTYGHWLGGLNIVKR